MASSGPGLRFSWTVYRGKATAVDVQPGSDEDVDGHARIREFRVVAAVHDSIPPPDGKMESTATFTEPGTYVLRGIASDGSLFTYENVTVTVTP